MQKGMFGQSTNYFEGLTPSELKELPCFIFYPHESVSVNYALGYLDYVVQARMVTAIHAGVRIASAIVVSSLLLLLARTYKSAMFFLYQLNFVLMVISSSLQLAWLFSFIASITESLTNGDIPHRDLNLSVASSIFQVFLMMSLLATLVMQIYVACSDVPRVWQLGATAVGAIACFPSYFIWMWRFVLTAIHDLGRDKGLGVQESPYHRWAYRGAWPAFAASTSACSAILCVKLWMVYRRRAQMGVERFDPVRTLLTMAAQNSVIPAILAIVSAAISDKNFGGQSVSASTIPVTAVLLPAGYIMAQYNMLRGTSEARATSPGSYKSESRSEKSRPFTAESTFSEIESLKRYPSP